MLQHVHMLMPANTAASHFTTGIGKASVVCEDASHTTELLAEPV